MLLVKPQMLLRLQAASLSLEPVVCPASSVQRVVPWLSRRNWRSDDSTSAQWNIRMAMMAKKNMNKWTNEQTSLMGGLNAQDPSWGLWRSSKKLTSTMQTQGSNQQPASPSAMQEHNDYCSEAFNWPSMVAYSYGELAVTWGFENTTVILHFFSLSLRGST